MSFCRMNKGLKRSETSDDQRLSVHACLGISALRLVLFTDASIFAKFVEGLLLLSSMHGAKVRVVGCAHESFFCNLFRVQIAWSKSI